MTHLSYVEPMPFADGQTLGRGNLGVLADNDEYFYGLARGWRWVAPCCGGGGGPGAAP